jgi:acyl-CoA thioesterase FadM
MGHVEHADLLRSFETMALNLMQKRLSQQKLQNGTGNGMIYVCRIRYTQRILPSVSHLKL